MAELTKERVESVLVRLDTIYTSDYPDGMSGPSPKEVMTEAAAVIRALRSPAPQIAEERVISKLNKYERVLTERVIYYNRAQHEASNDRVEFHRGLASAYEELRAVVRDDITALSERKQLSPSGLALNKHGGYGFVADCEICNAETSTAQAERAPNVAEGQGGQAVRAAPSQEGHAAGPVLAAAPDDGMVMLSKRALAALLTEARQERAERSGHRVPAWDVPPEQRTAAGITVLDVPCSTHLAMNCPRCYPPRGDSR